MEGGAASGRSERAGSDQEHDAERCHVLDVAARIVFGVSVMDRQIEEYLALRGSDPGSSREERAAHAQRVRQMSLDERCKRIGELVAGISAAALYEEVRGIKAVRNALAHSTVGIVPGGTVGFGGGEHEYGVGALEDALERTDLCNGRLRDALGGAPRPGGPRRGGP